MRRLQRRRSKTFVRPMSYTGLEPRVQRQQPRSAIRPTTSTTTLPEQPEQQNGLLSMLAMKEGWDQGQKVRKGILDGTYEDKWDKFTGNVADRYDKAVTGLSDVFSGSKTLTGIDQLPAQGMDLYGGTTGARWDMLANTAQPMDAGVLGFNVQSAPVFDATGNMIPTGSEVMGSAHNFAMPIDQAKYAGSTMIGGDAVTGMETTKIGDTTMGMEGGSQPWLSYANIAKDLAMGSDKLTGNQWGDAAIRVPLAYATGGLSELGYAFGDMVDWW